MGNQHINLIGLLSLFCLSTFISSGLGMDTHTEHKRQISSSLMFSNSSVIDHFQAINHPFLPQRISAAEFSQGNTSSENYDDIDEEKLSTPNRNNVVPTNAWISNLFYSSLNNMAPVNSDPYTLRLLDTAASGGNLGVSVTQKQSKILGGYSTMNNVPGSVAGYMLNEVVVDMRLTCREWVPNHPSPPTIQVTSWDHFGATAKLGNNDAQWMEVPISRGMAYVTTHYHALTPQFFSQYPIVRVETDHQERINATTVIYRGERFKLTLGDSASSTFLIYALDGGLDLTMTSNFSLTTSQPYTGTIRLAKALIEADEAILDEHSNTWVIGGDVETNDSSYTIRWKTQGQGEALIYAYPHHMQTLKNVERTVLRLESATKGTMYAVKGNQWTLEESSANNHGGQGASTTDWFPLQQTRPEASTINDIMIQLAEDIEKGDYEKDTNKNDNYFSGKALQKYALLALLANKPDITGLKNPELAILSLDKLKSAFSVFIENRQKDPFYYDRVYKGIVARSGLPLSMGGSGDIQAAFGHTYYNDHHYHQGYLVVTAAILHYLDPHWRSNEIRSWTEVLIRDVNSPVEDDYFPAYRNWDWFAGHTWAGGIKVNGAMDGRDQESVPEAVNFYWGMKLWALATNNPTLTKLADLQLDIMKRTTFEYFWMLNSNKNRHIGLVSNKVVGILFEQKLDYTTYFGRYMEYIHGIQQLPMTPMLADVFKIPQFVREEWDQCLAPIITNVKSSWAGVLYLNYALINPIDAYQLLKRVKMDDGQTRSYSLYLAATRPGFRRRSRMKLLSVPSVDSAQPDVNAKISRLRQMDISNNQHDNRYDGY